VFNDAADVLVVDDERDCRDLVANLLEEAGFRVHAVASGEAALASIRDGPPCAVILDVNLTAMSGYEVCHRLRERFGDALPILFISGMRAEAIDRVAGLLLGADDYITKPFNPDELVARVRRRVIGSRRGEAVMEDGEGTESGTAGGHGLTERESEVLTLLAEGLDQEAVAERLVISPSTVATHIQRILSKLGVRSRAQAIAVAYRTGILGRPIPSL
jgi:DNA-binding NarL/FixJ family response regulator